MPDGVGVNLGSHGVVVGFGFGGAGADYAFIGSLLGLDRVFF